MTTMMMSRLLPKHRSKSMLLTWAFLSEDKGDEKRKADNGHVCGRTPTAKMAFLSFDEENAQNILDAHVDVECDVDQVVPSRYWRWSGYSRWWWWFARCAMAHRDDEEFFSSMSAGSDALRLGTSSEPWWLWCQLLSLRCLHLNSGHWFGNDAQAADVNTSLMSACNNASWDCAHRTWPPTPRCHCDFGDASGNLPWMTLGSEGGGWVIESLWWWCTICRASGAHRAPRWKSAMLI